ncbi:PAP2 superfamily protein [[Clostridium] aminophilum]|uniref:PAP2 superfamily protein n=1 Tax=[Clostridium] aminophilum TaxID=1526 RepID=A0A1I0DSZ4_9FIRM|nr:phosphatase PAP2 family protein [[Clostridium] aminophilum]SET35425.1 PAP2 superfamily protein [[Clostridium] aminophilum]
MVGKFLRKYAYAFFPVIAALVLNTTGYVLIGKHALIGPLHDFSIPLDHRIPLVPVFIFIYIGAFLQWAIGYLTAMAENPTFCYKAFSSEIYAKILALICFAVIPSTIIRPEVDGTGIACALTRFVYAKDFAVNLFPSIHCLESWFCFRTAMAEHRPNWYKTAMAVMTVLVCLSVVFVRQHVIVDIIGGIAVMEIGFLIARRWDLSWIFHRIGRKVYQKLTELMD